MHCPMLMVSRVAGGKGRANQSVGEEWDIAVYHYTHFGRSWGVLVWQPLLITECKEDFQETFFIAYAVVRIRSQWIRSFLGSNITQPLSTRLNEANIHGTINPPDTQFNGSSGEVVLVVVVAVVVVVVVMNMAVVVVGGGEYDDEDDEDGDVVV